jgi:hypothetical protein
MGPQMKFHDSFVAMPREGANLPGRWGLYAIGNDRWLDVVFATEREANDAIYILKSGALRRERESARSKKVGYLFNETLL